MGGGEVTQVPWRLIKELCELADLDTREVYRVEITPRSALFKYYLLSEEGKLFVDPDTQEVACDALVLEIEEPY